MQWALVAVILIGLFFLSGKYPKVAFTIFGLLVTGIVAVLVITGDRVRDGRVSLSHEDIALSNMTATSSYAGSYLISGRIKNNHESVDLRESRISVLMQDCDGENQGSCDIVGQKSERISTRIPAGQARDFHTTLYFGNPAINNTLKWQFELTEARN